MKALVKYADGVKFDEVAQPQVHEPTDVLIRNEIAGICRTDIFAAQGLLPCAEPVVLGHEFVGIVEEVGSDVHSIAPGDRVVAMPIRHTQRSGCDFYEMLGVDFDGAFSEFVVMPSHLLYKVPHDMEARYAAYAEPAAAALAPLNAAITPGQKGYVFGSSRLAELNALALSLAGFGDVPFGTDPEPQHYDFVVEADPWNINKALAATRTKGTLILKSRPYKDVELDLIDTVRREINLQGCHYGCFLKAIDWLYYKKLHIEHLLGPIHDLSEHSGLFEGLLKNEEQKHFFRCEQL